MAPPSTSVPLSVRLIAVDPPGNCYGDDTPVVIGVQRGTDVEQIAPATVTAAFDVEIKVVDDGDFRGPSVHGRRGDRFLYLVWGRVTPTAAFDRFARSNIMLNGIPPDLRRPGRDRRLVCTVQDSRSGAPASGRLRPGEVSWALEAQPAV